MTTRPLNYTTAVPVARTVGEVQAMLGDHGANAIMVRYEGRRPVGLSFTINGPHGERVFTLPVDAAAMEKVLQARHRAKEIDRRYATPEHAEKVAWRVVKDWLAAQLALVAAQMASLDQVMLPYLHVDGELTLYEKYRLHERQALEAPGSAR